MIPDRPEVWQIGSENHVVEKLPDGSTAVLEISTGTVHSINQTAAAAFEACYERRTVPQVAAAMREILQSPVTEEMAIEAIEELERAGLVACSESRSSGDRGASRRSLLKAVGTAAATAAPLVLSLSAAEQSAYAATVASGPAPSIDGDDSNTVCTNALFAQTLFIDGQNTHFSQGTSVVTFPGSAWLTVGTVTVTSTTSLSVQVTPGAGAPSGSGQFSAMVVTGAESVTGVNIFYYTTCS